MQLRYLRRSGKYILYTISFLCFYFIFDNLFPGDPSKHEHYETKRAMNSRYHSSHKENLSDENAPNGGSVDKLSELINSRRRPGNVNSNSAVLPNSPQSQKNKYNNNENYCENTIQYFYLDIPPEPKLKHVYNVLSKKFNAKITSDITKANVIWYWYFPYSKKKRNGIEISATTINENTQILNNVPGTNFFTTKEYFVTNFIRDYIPEAHVAITPYLQENRRNYKWVIKHNDHRGIALYNQQQFKALDAKIADNTFLQRFIDNVFLIDGYKFDVALYVTLTNSRRNMAPKISIFNEWLLRFCPQKYNENHVDGYVIHDEYKHPSTIKTLNFDDKIYNGREALLEYLERRDIPIAKTLENKMHQIIRDVVNSHTYQIEQNTERWSQNKLYNFFQMVRFDFIIDSNYKVWLMEINMSPNLDSGHFAANAVLYERVIEWALREGYHDRCLDE